MGVVKTIQMELDTLLLITEPIKTAEGRPENPFRASRIALQLLQAEEINPECSVNFEVYSATGKVGFRAPISLRLTGPDAMALGEHLMLLGRECLQNERK